MYDSIVDFAEIEQFMDQKLKNYSSGMQVRLAFSIAIRAKSDILLIDEVLAVGDAAFQSKCFDYFYELKRSDTTVIFVSHDQGSLERFCDRGVLVNDGEVVTYGKMQDVLRSYREIVLEELDHNKQNRDEDQESGDIDYAEIFDVAVRDGQNKKTTKFFYKDNISIDYKIKVKRTISNPVFGVTVWQKNVDKAILATNTLIDGVEETGKFIKGDIITFSVKLPNNLNSSEYIVEPAIANDSTTLFYDKRPDAIRFNITGGKNPHSVISFIDKSKYTVQNTLDPR
jgi:ABC-2 type transport system ATP-binding protein